MQRAGKALIAEPNLRLAQRIGQEIEALGLSPEYARDGAQALEALSQNGYALLVTDLVLPQVSGAELARRVRKTPEGQSLRIEIISPPVKDPAAVDRLCAELSLGPYFKMPFNFGTFRQVTQAYLAKGAPGASAVAQHQGPSAPAPAPSPAPPPVPVARPPALAAPPRPAPPVASAPAPRPPAPAAPAPVPPRAPGGTPLTAPASPTPEKPAPFPAAPSASPAKSLTWGPGQPIKGFDQFLLHLRKEKFNGRARVDGNSQIKMIEFARGLPVSALSLLPARPLAERLGQIPGLIAGERGALGVRAGNDETGLTLVQMGAVPWGNLLTERTKLIAEELAECFSWGSGGQASLESLPEGPGSALAGLWGLPILAAAILDGAKSQTASAQGIAQIEAQLGSRFLAKTGDFFELAHLLPIEGDARGLLDAATGAKPFKMVLSHASDRAAWVRLAWGLLLLGMLKSDGKAHEDAKAPFPIRPFKQTPPPAPPAPKPAVPLAPERMEVMSVSEDPLAAAKPKGAAPQTFEKLDLDLEEDLGEVVEMIREVPGKAAAPAQPSGDRGLEEQLIDELDRVKKANYYQIFGARPDRFNFQDVKKAYFDLQRKFSPDKFVMSAGDMMSKCEEFLDRVSKAFETLSNIEKKQVYDAQLSKQKMLDQDKKSGGGLQASVSFESGRALIKEGDFASAEKEIRTAMRLAPGNVEHEVYLARAMYLNPKNKNDPANHIRARQMLDQCLIKNPRLAAGYAFRASIFLDQGKVDLAFGDLAKALKFDPNMLHAKNEMRRLEQLRQQQK